MPSLKGEEFGRQDPLKDLRILHHRINKMALLYIRYYLVPFDFFSWEEGLRKEDLTLQSYDFYLELWYN